MSVKPPDETPGSPVPGVIPEPAMVVHDPPAPAPRDPGAEREARRQERERGRAPRPERGGVMIPDRRKRLPLEAPLMRAVATAGIVGIAVVVAVIMSSQGAQAWVVGLATSLVSLVLAAVLWSSRRL